MPRGGTIRASQRKPVPVSDLTSKIPAERLSREASHGQTAAAIIHPRGK